MESADKRAAAQERKERGKSPEGRGRTPEPKEPRPQETDAPDKTDAAALEEELEEGLEDSFPASDPPSVTQRPR